MDIRQLKYFVGIADVGSITRASESLNIAQPALTQQIAKLEADLRIRVFDRGTSGVKLTSAGTLLYRYATSIIKQVEDARIAVSDRTKHPAGRVKIGMPGSTGKLLSVPLLQKLRSHDQILLEIVERPSSELLALVANGKLDLAVVVDALPARGTILTPLLLEDLLVVARRDAVGSKRSITIEEVAQNPLILPSWPSTIRQRIDTAFIDAQLNRQLVGEVTATDFLIRIVKAGMGWTVLPWAAVADEINRGQLVALPIRGMSLRRELSVCVPDTLMPGIEAQMVMESVPIIVKDLISSKQWLNVELPSAALSSSTSLRDVDPEQRRNNGSSGIRRN